MKVLVLRRDSRSGAGALAGETHRALEAHGVEATLADADAWMPKSLDPRQEPEVSERLRGIAEGFDIVHAFGYRCAWACAEAFRKRGLRAKEGPPWVYTAYQLPASVHPSLVARLDRARAGLCVSTAVLWALENAMTTKLRVVRPAISTERHAAQPTTDEHLPTAVAFVGPSFQAEAAPLLGSLATVWTRVPDARMILAGPDSIGRAVCDEIDALGRPQAVEWRGWLENPANLIAEGDVVVLARPSTGTSFVGLRAMAAGRAILARREGGLPELVQDLESGFVFENDGDLPNMLGAALQTPLRLEAMGRSARIRAETQFEIADRVPLLLEAYAGEPAR